MPGSTQQQEPDTYLIEQAHQCLKVAQPMIDGNVTYAWVEGDFQLMKLELIEPELFFSSEKAACFVGLVAKELL